MTLLLERLDSSGSNFPSHPGEVQNPYPRARKTVICHKRVRRSHEKAWRMRKISF